MSTQFCEIKSPTVDQLIDRLEAIETVISRILRQPLPSVDRLAYSVCLLHLARTTIPQLLSMLSDTYQGLQFSGDRFKLSRGVGANIAIRSARNILTSPDPIDVAGLAKTQLIEKRFNAVAISIDIFARQLSDLCAVGLSDFMATKPAKRLIGDCALWSIIVCWANRASILDSKAEGHSLFGWADNRQVYSWQLFDTLRNITKANKRLRQQGILQVKGTPAPSIAQFDRARLSMRQSNDRELYGSIALKLDIARQWLSRSNVIDGHFRTTRQSTSTSYRVFMDQGIRQCVVNRWAENHGLDVARVYPRVTWIGQPEYRDTAHGLVYVAPCCWGEHERSTGWLVWLANEKTEGFHVSCASVDQAVADAIVALERRARANRAAAEADRIRQLSIRSKRAYLVKQCRSIDQFQLADSYSVGNCKPGTSAFCQRLGIEDRDNVPGRELANRWRKTGYVEQSYFERVILGKGRVVS
jgi:hypothetical protein